MRNWKQKIGCDGSLFKYGEFGFGNQISGLNPHPVLQCPHRFLNTVCYGFNTASSTQPANSSPTKIFLPHPSNSSHVIFSGRPLLRGSNRGLPVAHPPCGFELLFMVPLYPGSSQLCTPLNQLWSCQSQLTCRNTHTCKVRLLNHNFGWRHRDGSRPALLINFW